MPVKLIKRYGVWHIDDTLGPPGRRVHVRQSTKTPDKKKAQRFATEIEGKIWKGSFDGPSAILTFSEAVKIYRGAGKDNKFLDPVEKYLGDVLVQHIKASTLKQMAIELFPGNSGASMNRRALTPVQSVINFCAEAELCEPLMIKNRFEEDGEPKEPATMEWVQAFGTTAGEVLSPYALFMFLTGCRPSEGLAIDPERDLDLKAGIVTIRNNKVRGQHKGKRKAHLPAMLVSALANLPTESGRPLFWYRTYNSMTWPWDQAIKRAKIEHLTPHCCRHGCATQLLRRGVDVVTVGWLIDMTPQMVLETYGHALKDATLTNRIIDTPLTRALTEVAENAVTAMAS
jgi:Phage integrase family